LAGFVQLSEITTIVLNRLKLLKKMEFYRSTLSSGSNFVGAKTDTSCTTLGIGIPIGSRNDPENAIGLSHLVEHILFESKSDSSRKRLLRNLEGIGGRAGAQTDFGSTLVTCTVPNQYLKLGTKFLATLVYCPLDFTCHDLFTEREVIYQEIAELHDTPRDTAGFLAHQLLFEPPIGRSVLGTKESLENITSKEIHNFWKKHYRTDRFTISSVGGVDPKESAEYFDNLLVDTNGTEKYFPEVQEVIKINQSREFLQEGLNQAHIVLAKHMPSATSSINLAGTLLDYFLVDAGQTAEIPRELRERGLCYGVSSILDGLEDFGYMAICTGVDPDSKSIARAFRIIRGTFKKAEKLSKPEFLNLRKKTIGSLSTIEFDTESYVQEFLYREHSGAKAESFFEIASGLRKITLEQFSEVATLREHSTSIIRSQQMSEISNSIDYQI